MKKCVELYLNSCMVEIALNIVNFSN